MIDSIQFKTVNLHPDIKNLLKRLAAAYDEQDKITSQARLVGNLIYDEALKTIDNPMVSAHGKAALLQSMRQSEGYLGREPLSRY